MAGMRAFVLIVSISLVGLVSYSKFSVAVRVVSVILGLSGLAWLNSTRPDRKPLG
jgi:hypothetical protein